MSKDGTFALTLLAFDRMGHHQVEPWRITWSGPPALVWYAASKDQLKAGQPLNVRVEKMRNFTNGQRHGGPEFVVQATSIELASAPIKRGDQSPASVTSY